ncbi:MAG: deoxynucleoside kinase [Bacteroidetes bacterium]|nr:deoxynucleoside kinase [Bacteroidota bacterium]
MHIAIAGNIGSGKTTLTQLLAKHYKWDQLQEAVDNNPYLFDFYKDMQRWSFNLQIFFLNSRFEQLLEIRRSGRNVVQDRTIYEDAYIFAPNLHAMGLMTTRDFENYFRLFQNMDSAITPPDLMIYLRASVPNLVRQIAERGREYETSISIDYLKRLHERYEAWISTYDKGKILIIDVDDNAFHTKPEDLGKIITSIDAEIHGLFPAEAPPTNGHGKAAVKAAVIAGGKAATGKEKKVAAKKK